MYAVKIPSLIVQSPHLSVQFSNHSLARQVEQNTHTHTPKVRVLIDKAVRIFWPKKVQ